MRILLSDRPILATPAKYVRMQAAPSSVAGKHRALTLDGSRVLSVLPDGSFIMNPSSGHDGGYEAAELAGNRWIYDYPEMTGDPVVFDVMVQG